MQWERGAPFPSHSNSKAAIYALSINSHKTCRNKWSKSQLTMTEMRQRRTVPLSWPHSAATGRGGPSLFLQHKLTQALPHGCWFGVKVTQWHCSESNVQLSPDFSPKLHLQHGVPFAIKHSLCYAHVTLKCSGYKFYCFSFWVYFTLCILLIKVTCKRKKMVLDR